MTVALVVQSVLEVGTAQSEWETPANARLIAAAPDMAALLERIVERKYIPHIIEADARALLAKIKGETNDKRSAEAQKGE